jgi:catechol 2,3-dioxygenase-like lactoylglutathione lyase family enzyme
MDNNVVTGKVRLPPLGQVGMVVRDIDRVVEFYSSTFGIGPWVIKEGDSEARARDKIYRYNTRTAFAHLGPVILELFQLTEGRSPVHSEFLDKGREGVHHLGFYMSKEEKDQIIADLATIGVMVAQSAEIRGRGSNAFLDTERTGGLFLELIAATPMSIPDAPKPSGKVTLPPSLQVGVVVKDLDAVVGFYSSTLGIGPWQTREGGGETTVGGHIYSFKNKVTFARLDPVMLELFQVTEGRSPVHSVFLDKGREGVHHLGFYMSEEEKAQMTADLVKGGIPFLQGRETEHGSYAFFDTETIGGMFFELIGRYTK